MVIWHLKRTKFFLLSFLCVIARIQLALLMSMQSGRQLCSHQGFEKTIIQLLILIEERSQTMYLKIYGMKATINEQNMSGILFNLANCSFENYARWKAKLCRTLFWKKRYDGSLVTGSGGSCLFGLMYAIWLCNCSSRDHCLGFICRTEYLHLGIYFDANIIVEKNFDLCALTSLDIICNSENSEKVKYPLIFQICIAMLSVLIFQLLQAGQAQAPCLVGLFCLMLETTSSDISTI